MTPCAIITADGHFRPDQPLARTDDFLEAQEEVMVLLQELQAEHECPVLWAGDILHKAKGNPEWFLSWLIEHMPAESYAIQGNHDLPAHSLTNYPKSSLHVIEMAEKVNILTGPKPFGDFTAYPFPFGELPEAPKRERTGKKVAVCHFLTCEGKDLPFPDFSGPNARRWANKFDGIYDLVIIGDNHKTFTAKSKSGKCTVLSPGSLFRFAADQMGHEPCVWLLYPDMSLEPHYLPKGKLSRKHIEQAAAKDERLLAFVEKLQQETSGSLNYRDNLTKYMSVNKIEQRIQDVVWRMVDGD